MVFERWNAIMISFLGLGENHPAKKRHCEANIILDMTPSHDVKIVLFPPKLYSLTLIPMSLLGPWQTGSIGRGTLLRVSHWRKSLRWQSHSHLDFFLEKSLIKSHKGT